VWSAGVVMIMLEPLTTLSLSGNKIVEKKLIISLSNVAFKTLELFTSLKRFSVGC